MHSEHDLNNNNEELKIEINTMKFKLEIAHDNIKRLREKEETLENDLKSCMDNNVILL